MVPGCILKTDPLDKRTCTYLFLACVVLFVFFFCVLRSEYQRNFYTVMSVTQYTEYSIHFDMHFLPCNFKKGKVLSKHILYNTKLFGKSKPCTINTNFTKAGLLSMLSFLALGHLSTMWVSFCDGALFVVHRPSVRASAISLNNFSP